jgi:hypothetical protein
MTTRGPYAWIGYVVDRDRAHDPFGFCALFKLVSPSAILSLIISSGINAVNSVFGAWLLAHVAQECNERCTPLIADTDAVRSVFRKIFAFGIAAPALNPKPSLVSWAGLSSPLVSVCNHVNCISETILSARK